MPANAPARLISAASQTAYVSSIASTVVLISPMRWSASSGNSSASASVCRRERTLRHGARSIGLERGRCTRTRDDGRRDGNSSIRSARAAALGMISVGTKGWSLRSHKGMSRSRLCHDLLLNLTHATNFRFYRCRNLLARIRKLPRPLGSKFGAFSRRALELVRQSRLTARGVTCPCWAQGRG
jgi:hypothetical protein